MSSIKLRSEQTNSSVNKSSKKKKSNEELLEAKKKELKTKANRTEYLLEYILAKMEVLEFENFDSLFPELVSKMKEATLIRDELLKEIEPPVLIKVRPKLFSVAKQIEKKYEILMEKFSAETEQLQRELSSTNNQKKITNYLR